MRAKVMEKLRKGNRDHRQGCTAPEQQLWPHNAAFTQIAEPSPARGQLHSGFNGIKEVGLPYAFVFGGRKYVKQGRNALQRWDTIANNK